MRAAFDIPAINNQKEALARFLCINSDIESEFSRIEENGIHGLLGSQVHCFRFEGNLYLVASNGLGLIADKVVEFNSSLWAIKHLNKGASYARFHDSKVKKKLNTLAPDGYELVAINQQEHKILFRNKDDKLEIFRYTSHIPEDISSYYIVGSTDEHPNNIKNIFGSNF